MRDQPRIAQVTSLLDALHESRRRQAVREIHYYSHLIDETKASEMWRAIELSRLKASQHRSSAASHDLPRVWHQLALRMVVAQYMRALTQAVRLLVSRRPTALMFEAKQRIAAYRLGSRSDGQGEDRAMEGREPIPREAP
jgi:hypothetical protein